MGEYLWYAELAGARLASADFDTFVLPSDVSDVEQAHQNAAFVAHGRLSLEDVIAIGMGFQELM